MLPKLHWIKGLDPVADAFAGTVTSDVVNAVGEGVLWVIHKGVGTTGTSTITVLACDDTTPSNTTAVAFMYRTNTADDTWSAWTRATTAGFATTAGSSQMYQIYVESAELGSEDYGYAQLKAVEVANDPVLGGISCAIVNPRHSEVDGSLID